MEQVKQYVVADGLIDLGVKGGTFVRLEDYAALQQKLDAVLAENAEIKSGIADITFMRDHDFFASTQEAQRVMGSLVNIKTPATDNILNEVRAEAKAKGVEEYAESLSYQALKMREIDQPRIRVASVNAEAKRARYFADQLRAGSAEGGV